MIGDQGDPRVGRDVGQASEGRRPFGLVIHRGDDRVVLEREGHRHQVRLPGRVHGGEPGDPGGGEPAACLTGLQVHRYLTEPEFILAPGYRGSGFIVTPGSS